MNDQSISRFFRSSESIDAGRAEMFVGPLPGQEEIMEASDDTEKERNRVEETSPAMHERAVNTIRMLSVDMVEKANSGHPGMPLGAAAMAYVVWTEFLRHNPRNPHWPNRDRFVLSAGHGSALLYSLLHLCGYDLPLSELMSFRQWGSLTPGHPERGLTPGVETTTGPLGQGFANGVGMALAERFLSRHFNRDGFPLVDHWVYGIVSDGDLMEGIASEAASLAGHMGLGKLIYLYDDNKITIDGSTDLSFSEDVRQRFQSYGWHVQSINGMDLDDVRSALAKARAEQGRPSIICARTHIGYGSPKQDSETSHGSPLGEVALRAAKDFFEWPTEPRFYIPDDVSARFEKVVLRGEELEGSWKGLFDQYAKEHVDEMQTFIQFQDHQLPEGWDAELPSFEAGASMATRKASGSVLQALARTIPNLVGGSADLSGSNNTPLKEFGDLGRDEPRGRNICFGVREHAMAGVANGMALHGGIRPYVGTFLVFSDYMRPSIRLAALSHLPVVFVFTHDSIGLGEDGPTHQPVEHLVALRTIPNLVVLRPADAAETKEAWRHALTRRRGPTALCLTRQGLPILDRSRFASAALVSNGAYVLEDVSDPELVLIASGSEVSLALQAADALNDQGIRTRTVSMPSWELFRRQDSEYQRSVLPPGPKRLAIEAGVTLGWREWVGSDGDVIGIDRFGASAPAKDVFTGFGFTVEDVTRRGKTLLGR